MYVGRHLVHIVGMIDFVEKNFLESVFAQSGSSHTPKAPKFQVVAVVEM
jgi:hypothetical protein